MSKTILDYAMRNTNELHEPLCQKTESGKQIHDADCSYENSIFTLLSLPCALPPLFTVRFTAPADFRRGSTLKMKGRTFAFKTSDMEEAKEKKFAAGAVVLLMVDMERGLAFFPSDHVDLSEYVQQSRSINTEDPLFGGGDLGADRTLGIEDASTSRKGAVQLSSATDSESETVAATAKAVKTVFTFAAGKADAVHTHPMSDVTGLDASLATKAPVESPAFTGVPTAPSPAGTDNSDAIATTKWVKDQDYVTVADHESALTSYVPKTRTIATAAPLHGGGDLSADRTLTVSDASTTEKGVVQLCDETDNVSTSLAATASSVKATYDLAASKADTSIATVTTDGLMSAMDKARLDSGGMVYTSLILYVRTGGQAGNDGLTEATPFGTVQQAIDAMHARYRGRITRAYIDVGPGKFESTIITGSYNSGTSFDVLEIGGAGVDATTIQVPSAVDPGHITTTFSLQNCTVEYLRTGSHEYGAFIWQSQIGSKTLRTSNVRIRIHADSAIPSYHLHSGSSSLTYFLNGDLDFEGSSANAPIYISNGSHVEGYGLTSLKFVNGNTDALIWLTSGANAVFPKEVRPSFSNFSYQRTFRLLWGASLTLRSSVKEAWMNGKPNHIDSSSVLKEF